MDDNTPESTFDFTSMTLTTLSNSEETGSGTATLGSDGLNFTNSELTVFNNKITF
jgi:hypothetical protein